MTLKYELSGASLLKLSSFVCWSWLYLFVTAVRKRESPEWCSRAVTLLHGTVATVVGLMQCGITNISRCSLTKRIMPYHYALMVWSWGYFCFDLLWCLLYWNDNLLMLCHHSTALAAITVYMQKDYTGCTFACTLAMMEVTNPLLQMRWFLRHHGFDKTIAFNLIEGIYLVIFFGLRGILGSYLMYKIYLSDIFDLDEKFISLVFYLVSLAFLYDIYGFIIHKYKNDFICLKDFLDNIGFKLNFEI